MYSCSKIAGTRGLSSNESSPSWAMIGNISLGISLENGSSRVPIPPAVISAVNWSRRFEAAGSRIDSEYRLPTRCCSNAPRERRRTSTSCFQHGYNHRYVPRLKHIRIHGEYALTTIPPTNGITCGGACSPGHYSSGFRHRCVIRVENNESGSHHGRKWIHRKPLGGKA